MRIANVKGRGVVLQGNQIADIADASSDQFGPEPQDILDHWDAFRSWYEANSAELKFHDFDQSDLGAPIPLPRQIFAVGLNYAKHAEESQSELPSAPLVFTKFQTSITGPHGDIRLTGDEVDWEVELVAVIGREATNVSEDDALSYVAGYTAGQDISDRTVQLAGSAAQYSLGKSFAGFAPIGPSLVTLDEFENVNDVSLSTRVNGETRQHDRTSSLVFSVPYLVSYLSSIVTLLPGDLIFTGTPDGVGLGMRPQVYLKDQDVVETEIDVIGQMSHRFVR